jgi:TonB family protein
VIRVNSTGDGVTFYNTATGPTGQWSFNGLAPGTYAIAVAVPGFTGLKKLVEVNPGSNDQGVFHLSLGRLSESLTVMAQASSTSAGLAAQPQAQSSPRPIRVGGNVQAAKLIHRVDPVFPQSARDKGVQGPVTIQAIIGKDGFIRDTLVSQAPPDLAQAAIDAVRLWQFEPTRLNGEPVEIMTEITVNFQLQ